MLVLTSRYLEETDGVRSLAVCLNVKEPGSQQARIPQPGGWGAFTSAYSGYVCTAQNYQIPQPEGWGTFTLAYGETAQLILAVRALPGRRLE